MLLGKGYLVQGQNVHKKFMWIKLSRDGSLWVVTVLLCEGL